TRTPAGAPPMIRLAPVRGALEQEQTPDRQPRHGRTGRMRKLLVLALLIALAGCGKKPALHKGKTAAEWRQALSDPDLHVRAEARRGAITAMGALKVKDTVPELTTALGDADDQVRSRAAEALWSLGPAAKEAVSALTPLLRDNNATIRLNAAGALGEIGPDAA